jgi:manganese/zinc/iron transport system substrate-binding protein
MMAKKTFQIIILGIFLLSFITCKKSGTDIPVSERKIKVVSTIGMINDVVANIGGERVLATGLMGPGIDPHLYKASAGDVKKLSDADIIFYNGLHLEAKMGEVLENMQGSTMTVAVTGNVDESLLLSHQDYEGLYDPHLWFDVSIWITVCETIMDSLVALDPDNAQVYRDNFVAYRKLMEELDQYVKVQAALIPEGKRVLITAHDAFKYFGKAYGFTVKGLQGISTVSEVGAADIQDLADFISNNRIPAIFVESSVPKQSVEALKEAVESRGFSVSIGGELFSDAMGNPGTDEGTYLGMVKHNIDTIKNGLAK